MIAVSFCIGAIDVDIDSEYKAVPMETQTQQVTDKIRAHCIARGLKGQENWARASLLSEWLDLGKPGTFNEWILRTLP